MKTSIISRSGRERAVVADRDRAPERQKCEDRPKQAADNRAADQRRRGERPARPEVAAKQARLARVDDQRLHPTLLPAHALPEPVLEFMRSFLGVSEFKRSHPIAEAREANAEIGVLGHVPLVPGPDVDQRPDAKVIRGAAERDRQLRAHRGPD